MYFVYIIKSLSTNYYYKGLTNNLNRRLKEHDNKKTSSNRSYGPWKLIHVEICDNLTHARSIEKFFKSGYGREIIKEIETK